jgi:hypothetical protein
MARSRKTIIRRAISPGMRERLRLVARDQVATSMRIEGRSFPSVEAARQVGTSSGSRTSA